MAISFKNMRSEDDFEEMCRQLVCAENPNAIPVEASPGDEAMDAFEGVIDEEVDRVWQFKHFPHGIGRSQQDQIRRSLKHAIQRHTPKRWILLTSTDLGADNLRWLKKQKRDFPDVDIDVVAATQIRELLVRHQGVRKQYFPLQDEKTDALMRMLTGDRSEGLPKAEILQNVRDEVAILNDNSPDYRFSFAFDESGVRIGARPRTSDACGSPLAKFTLSFREDDAEARAALEEYKAAVNSGRPAVVPGRYVTINESVFDDFIGEGVAIRELRIVPKLPHIRLPTRVHVSSGELTATVAYVDLHLMRRGKTELEFSNATQTDTPFRINVILRDMPPASLKISLASIAGMRPSDVIGFERFLDIMGRSGAQVTLESLSTQATVTSAIEVIGEEVPRGRLKLFEDLLLIETELDPDLVLPAEIGEEDLSSILGIARALRTGRAAKRGTASVILVPNDPEQFSEFVESGEPLTWVTENGVEPFTLFGRLYEFDFDTRMTGPANVLEEGLECGGVRVGIAGDMYFTYRNGRCVDQQADHP